MELNIEEFERSIRTSKEANFIWDIEGLVSYNMKIYPKSILSPDVIIGTLKESGFKKDKITTYRGSLPNGNYVRLTVDTDFIYGVIKTDKGLLVIDQLKYVLNDKTIAPNKVVLYEVGKLVNQKGVCTMIEKSLKENEELSKATTGIDCKVLDLSIEQDLSFGSIYTTSGTTRMISIINIVEAAYTEAFNLEILIVSLNGPNNYYSTDPATIINEIQVGWAKPNFSSVDRDLVHHFTGKNLGSNLGRASGIGDICDNSSVSYTKARTGEFLTTAHEVGHNLNGLHSSGQFCGTSNATVMCQGLKRDPIYFSAANTTRISNFIDTQSCLDNHGIYIEGDSSFCGTSSGAYYHLRNIANTGVTTWTVIGGLEIIYPTISGNSVLVKKVGSLTYGVVRAEINLPGECNPIIVQKTINICQNKSNTIVFPNPTSNEINVLFNNDNLTEVKSQQNESSILLELYDIYGVQTKSEIFNNSSEGIKMNVSDLKAGIYILKVKGEEANDTHQIIIK